MIVALAITLFIAACIFFAVVIAMAAAEGDRQVQRARPRYAAMVEASKGKK